MEFLRLSYFGEVMKPSFEQLEDRCCPSTVPGLSAEYYADVAKYITLSHHVSVSNADMVLARNALISASGSLARAENQQAFAALLLQNIARMPAGAARNAIVNLYKIANISANSAMDMAQDALQSAEFWESLAAYEVR